VPLLLLPEVVLAAAADVTAVVAADAAADAAGVGTASRRRLERCKCALSVRSACSDGILQLLAILGLPEGRHSISMWVQSATSGRALTVPVQQAFYVTAAGSESVSRNETSASAPGQQEL
jgi:hypothetical protein